MLKLGVIGTSPISRQFIEAAQQSQLYRLAALYSRRLETAAAFTRHDADVAVFSDFAAFLAADVDVVYIASPNSLHAQQAKAVLAAGKHAIVEKPIVSTPSELRELRQLADQHQVYLFEAARNYHEAALTTIGAFLEDQVVTGASLSYAKYSSKMGELLTGRKPNVFSADFSGGALMDLGIYPLYAAIALFGAPKAARYTACQLPNSMDLNGCGQLIYEDFLVTLQTGKNLTSYQPSEIYTQEGTLVLDGCQHISQAVFHRLDGSRQELPLPARTDNPLLEEALAFAAVITQGQDQQVKAWLDVAQVVHDTLYSMRQDAGIQFKADTYEN